MRAAAVSAALVLFLASCARDINNKEALKAAVIEHLTARQGTVGLNLTQMDVEIGSMSFQQDQATATVAFKPKAGGEGMSMPYAFDKKNGKWVVRSRMDAGPGGHGAGMAVPGAGAPAPAGGEGSTALPPGHPPTGAGAAAPSETKGGAMPAGHPPVGATKK